MGSEMCIRDRTKIDEAEARLKTLNGREQQMRTSLDSRRADIVEVLAALQRAGRRTPPALPSELARGLRKLARRLRLRGSQPAV